VPAARLRLNCVEQGLAEERDRLQRTQTDQVLLPAVQRQGVENAPDLPRVRDLELRVQEQLSEAVAGQASGRCGG
jgi:hypothetical protein